MKSKLHHLESLDSTQDYARKHVASFDQEAFTIIQSDEQTKGRGRFNRHWYSPKGKSLAITYCFRIPKMPHATAPITLVLALSICEVLQKLGLIVKIKWPNDLYIESNKVGGILAEVETEKDYQQVFLGFGLNIHLTAEELSHQNFKATSLLIETGRKWDLKVLASSLETTFKRDLELFIEKGFYPFHKTFEGLSFFKGKTIRLDTGCEMISGLYIGVSEEGALILKVGEKLKTFVSGEVIGWE